MRYRDALEADLLALLPLDERDVERFEDLVAETARWRDLRAAEFLIGLLDDSVELGGVVQNVSDHLGEFPAEVLVDSFVSCLSGLMQRASHASRDLLRAILTSDEKRTRLLSVVGDIPAELVDQFREIVEQVAKFSRYADSGAELLASVPLAVPKVERRER